MLSQNQVKHITALRIKKYREEFGQFTAEGHKLVVDLINSSFNIAGIYASSGWITGNISLVGEKNIPFFETLPREMDRISSLATPSQVLAVVNIPATKSAVDLIDELISPSTHQPISPSSHQHIGTLAHQHIGTSAHQHISPSTHQPISPSSHQHIGTSAHQHIGTSAHQPISPSAHQHICTSAHQHISPSAHQPISPSAHQPISTLILALDDIRDPGNFGTIVRIADWFGIETVLCSASCVDFYNPKVVQATMGSIARVKLISCNLVETLSILTGWPVYGAFLEGESLFEQQPTGHGIILIGNESRGISPELEPCVTKKIFIPSFGDTSSGKAESLNASVATAIICAEFRKNQLKIKN